MAGIRDTRRFAELEYCMERYFNTSFAPVMERVQSNLQERQLQELKDYKSSASGVLTAMADASHMMPGIDSSLTHLQVAGKWNSKTTDDYLNMVRKEIGGNKTHQSDIALIAAEWRKATINEIGRAAYDRASKQLGTDLAYAYIDYRFEQLMLSRMADNRMPKSSIEYVLKKAGQRSIFGLSQMLTESAADNEISNRIEAKYKPSTIEKGAVRATAFGMDVVAMGGVGSWGTLAKLGGAEIVMNGFEDYTKSKQKGNRPLSIEECISQGVFGSKDNIFPDIKAKSKKIQSWEDSYVLSLNNRLSNKMGILTEKPEFYGGFNLGITPSSFAYNKPLSQNSQSNREGIPSVIAFGKEDEYRESQRKRQATQSQEKESAAENLIKQATDNNTNTSDSSEQPFVQAVQQSQSNTQHSAGMQDDNNLSGWGCLLSTFGLDGLSATGKNLGYVIAMLPEILFGAFTGKSKDLGLGDNLIPIASVLMGVFVKNPLLKMTLLGLGGANLLNKAGKEALSAEDKSVQAVQTVHPVRYKQYADEELNSRIANLSIQGNALLCTIDRVQATISLPPTTLAAYEAGALPLNILANAILARHDAMQQELALSYQQQYNNSQSISTGIK